MKNFYFFYYLGEQYSTLFFMNVSETTKIGDYDMTLLPTFPICDGCAVHSFSIKNNGNKKANKIILDIKSPIAPKLIYDSPKMTQKDCGGLYGSAGCYIVIENLNEKEEISFALYAKDASNIFITSCIADKKYRCDFKFYNILAQTMDAGNMGLMMNDKKVMFPTLENSEPNRIYYFDPKQFDEEKTGWIYHK